jgi:hypothetical protein
MGRKSGLMSLAKDTLLSGIVCPLFGVPGDTAAKVYHEHAPECGAVQVDATRPGGLPSPVSLSSGIVNSTFVSFMMCRRSSMSLGFIGEKRDDPAIISMNSALSHLRFIDI